MAAWLDNVRFNPTLGGTTDWTYSSAVGGYQSPASAGAVNGVKYKYFAIDASNNWELGEGAWNSGTTVLPRTTIIVNSLGTTAKINFAAAPQVAIVALKEDMISVEETNSFTTTQKQQACSNIGVTSVGQSGAGHIPGIAGNTAAAAGEVGEVISTSATTASLSSGVVIQAATITLTPGDWDISAVAVFSTASGTSVTDWYSAISLTSASLLAPIAGTLLQHERVSATSDHSDQQTHPPAQVLVSTNTTYYLNVRGDFTGTAPTVNYVLRARRMR